MNTEQFKQECAKIYDIAMFSRIRVVAEFNIAIAVAVIASVVLLIVL